ncbi:MAG: T9SS type A sorting domain-containing protein [Bacteroidales bacterium]
MKSFTFILFSLVVMLLPLSMHSQEVLRPSSVAKAVYFDVSPPLRDMVPIPPEMADRTWKTGVVKNFLGLRQPDTTPVVDEVVQRFMGKWISAGIGVNINGIGNINGVMPPDTDGDVGPNHYFQMINLSFQIFNKNGVSLYGPAANSTLWNGFPGPWSGSNDGDPIVLYDEYANRWIASQFALPNYPNGPFWELVAVSTTPDPTGSWYRYAFQFSDMPDYPKLGVWHNAYLLTANRFSSGSTTYKGVGVYALERSKMLVGDPNAAIISFTFSASAEPYSMLPADADGTPPPANEPAYFAYKKDPNKLVIYKMNIDWTNTSASTLQQDVSLTVANYSSSISGIPQPGTTRKLDAITDRLMFRLQYRNFGTHASMVTNHTVSVSGVAGVRWYEVRKTGSSPWTLYQQGTYAPDNHNRWMGSIAMDGFGNIALGYSVASSTVYPSIRYTGRMANDPLGQMTIQETEIVAGGGSQTGGFVGNGRWGDYSAMTVDPSAPSTFWFTTEYMQNTSSQNWKTRIASFSFDAVFMANLSVSTNPICLGDSTQLNANPTGGTGIYSFQWTSNPPGDTLTRPNPWVFPQSTTTYICRIISGTDTIYDSITVYVNQPAIAMAGPDTTVCEGPIQLAGQALNSSGVLWTTSGDGAFTVSGIPNPIYFPGPGDVQNGQVQLILSAFPLAPCIDTAYDTLWISISPLAHADAGPDTLICFWEIPYQFNAQASGHSSLEWTTSGDGYFDDPTSPTARYFPGEGDKQALQVVLTLTAHPINPCAEPATDPMTLLLDPCVGIEEPIASSSLLTIEPNPSSGRFTLTLNNSLKGEIALSIINSQGIEIYRENTTAEKIRQYPVNLSHVAAGTYVVKIIQGKASIHQKVIIH